jgi:hypothetical protein
MKKILVVLALLGIAYTVSEASPKKSGTTAPGPLTPPTNADPVLDDNPAAAE